MTCMEFKKCMIIRSMEDNGHFHGEVAIITSGHVQKPSALAAKSDVELHLRQKHNVGSPVIPPSITEEVDTSLAEESEIEDRPSHHAVGDDHLSYVQLSKVSTMATGPNISAELTDDSVQESTPCTLLNQSESNEHTYLEPTNVPDDVELSTVDSSSHSNLPPSMQSHYTSTTSEHKALDQGIDNTTIAGLPLNKERVDYEQLEKRKYTVHLVLHGLAKNQEDCDYDEAFASEFKKFLSRDPNTGPLSTGSEEDSDYLWYIEDHLMNKQCPSFCEQLWKFCITNNLCYLYKYADEGVLLYSKSREDNVGSICTDFADLENMEQIGKGGFGIAYLYTSASGEQFAVKKELKHPLINANPKLFNQIMKLKNPHVVETLEYLVAYSGQNSKKSYLLVMPFMNQKGLDEQFKRRIGCGSVLTYMKTFPSQKKFIFRNFLDIFHQLFEALEYLKTQKLVHRDVKASNILVQQNCSCESALMCACPEGTQIHCVLGDMNLACVEGESSFIASEMWHKVVPYEPAGTPRMKAPESFYRTGKGDTVVGHKSDVWSGCVTMINALIGREVNEVPDTQIGTFMKTATQSFATASKGIQDHSKALKNIIDKYMPALKEDSVNAAATGNMTSFLAELQGLHEKLSESGKALAEVQAFQGGALEAHRRESPLAGILFTVYVHICGAVDIITEGVRFIPEDRKDAGQIIDLLKPIEKAVML